MIVDDRAIHQTTSLYLSDIIPATVKIINEGNGSCGTAHHTIVADGQGVCRKCGRVVEYLSGLKIAAARHLKRTGQRNHDWPIGDLSLPSGTMGFTTPRLARKQRFTQ